MEKPVLRHVTRRHSCLEDAFAVLFFLREDRAFLLQNLDQAEQQPGKHGVRVQAKAGRHERWVGLEPA